MWDFNPADRDHPRAGSSAFAAFGGFGGPP
jgi:hypothetical protein